MLSKNLWIGITDIEVEDVWRFVTTDEVIGFDDFGSGQPSNSFGREHCVIIRHNKLDWNDMPCEN